MTGNLVANGNTIYINPFTGGVTGRGHLPNHHLYRHIQGSFAGAQTLLPSIYTFTVTNITSVTPNEIAVIVTGNPANLTWNNGSGNGQWDVLGSDNWTDRSIRSKSNFRTVNNAIFDDSITAAASPMTNVTVPSSVTVLPATVMVAIQRRFTP